MGCLLTAHAAAHLYVGISSDAAWESYSTAPRQVAALIAPVNNSSCAVYSHSSAISDHLTLISALTVSPPPLVPAEQIYAVEFLLRNEDSRERSHSNSSFNKSTRTSDITFSQAARLTRHF